MTSSHFVGFVCPTSLTGIKNAARSRIGGLGFPAGSHSPAHMMATCPMQYTRRELDSIDEKIGGMTSRKALQTFSVSLGKISHHAQGGTTTFYLPAGGRAEEMIGYVLRELKSPSFQEKGGIQEPHIVIATINTHAAVDLIRGELDALVFPDELKFEHAAIFEEETHGARVYIEFPFVRKAA